MQLFKTDIPERHLQMMLVCNSQRFLFQQAFYALKHKILEKHGHPDGMDLQIIKKTCHSCNGTGTFDEPGDCYKCGGSGVYTTNHYILKRYKINEHVFHVPVMDDPFAVKKHHAKCKNTINGLVQHKAVPGNPIFCYGLLLWLYDQNEFFIFLGSYGKGLNTTAKHKWKMIMRSSKSVLHGFFNYFNITLKQHTPEPEELPF